MGDGERATARRAVAFWGVAGVFVIVFALFQVAAQPLLLAFAGILFGTALRGLAEAISSKLHWRLGWSLVVSVAIVTAAAVGLGLWIVPSIAGQAASLSDRLTEAYAAARRALAQSPLAGQWLGESAQLGQELGKHFAQAAGILASAVGVVGAVVFVFFVALYVAGAPGEYRHGLVQLVPPRQRDRAREVLDALSRTLRRWLLGRMISMTAVGLATTLGLWLLDVPLPVTLGFIAGAFGFVPNIGPLVSTIPAALLALTVSPLHVLYVLVLYLLINLGDGYGLTPWVQKRAVAVPPALILTGQVVLGALWGVLGVMFATPLLACLLVLVRQLYVEDVLREPQPERPEP